MVEERDALRLQVETLERAAETEKDERSKQVQGVKTEAATAQENLQDKVISVVMFLYSL